MNKNTFFIGRRRFDDRFVLQMSCNYFSKLILFMESDKLRVDELQVRDAGLKKLRPLQNPKLSVI
jgi:hypothetical protein